MKKRTKRILVLSVLLLLSASVVVAYVIFRSSATRVTELTTEQVENRLDELTEGSQRAKIYAEIADQQGGATQQSTQKRDRFQGMGIAFEYPATYERREREQIEGKQRAVFIAGIGGTRRLVVSRESIPTTINEFSGIRMRRQNTETYKESSIHLEGGGAGLVFTRKTGSGYEKVLYLPSGNELITVSVSALSDQAKDQVTSDSEMITKSITVMDS